MSAILSLPILSVEYTNHHKERRRRRLIPVETWFGSTNWHTEPQYLLKCMDTEENNAVKDFALKDFHMETAETERV